MKRVALAVAVLLVPMTATAQQAARSFSELAAMNLVADEAKVRILYESGDEVETIVGKVIEVSTASIAIETSNPPPVSRGLHSTSIGGVFNAFRVEIPSARVREIRIGGDSLVNGALIGTGIGAGVGALIAIAARQAETWTFAEDNPTTVVLASVILSAAIGAGVGIGTDAVRKGNGETTVYLAPDSVPASLHVSWAPIVSRKRNGFLFTLVW